LSEAINKTIVPAKSTYVIAEIGINHNGSLELAERLMTLAAAAGCNAVKFQKRTIEVVYTAEELLAPRASVFGNTNGDLKRGLEFGRREFESLFRLGKKLGIDVFASVWDIDSVGFIEQFGVRYMKIPSPLLTHDDLLRRCGSSGIPIILSTGMSTMEEIAHAVKLLQGVDLTLLLCTSAYPCPSERINLNGLRTLRRAFGLPTGYSGHEAGIAPTIAAVALGAVVVERHITESRNLWGSDQAVSLEPTELRQLVQGIREVDAAMGDGRIDLQECEIPARAKLRRA
jgi:N-acetylneuraminate synthase